MSTLHSGSTTQPYHFAFGRPAARCQPSQHMPCDVMVIGAYPSSLHARWVSPNQENTIRAIPLTDEPTPFWTGTNEQQYLTEWKHQVGYNPATHGTITSAGHLNGSSGRWLDSSLLTPLGLDRQQTWITDCLVTYRMSRGVESALKERFTPFAERAGLTTAHLPTHPSESAIVREALEHERERLLNEIETCAPLQIYTLGNAALRVLRELVTSPKPMPTKLTTNQYGEALSIELPSAQTSQWTPLAHPAAPVHFQEAHRGWLRAHETC